MPNLELFPEGGGFNVNPASYMGENGYSALLRAGYFRGEEGVPAMADRDARNVVADGFGYWDFRTNTGGGAVAAVDLYRNLPDVGSVKGMDAIHLWVGSDYWHDKGDLGPGSRPGVPSSDAWNDPAVAGYPYANRPMFVGEADGSPDLTQYVAPTLSFANFAAIRTTLNVDANWNKLIGDGRFVTDWLNKATPTTAVTAADRAEFINKVEALWILRAGNQTDAYVAYRAKRSEGDGLGSGRLVGGANISGNFIVPEIRYELYGTDANIYGMTIQSASSAMAIRTLGSLLSDANMTVNWRTLTDQEWRARYETTDKLAITNDAINGALSPWAPEGAISSNATAPTQTDIRERFTTRTGANLDETRTWGGDRVCEFGMPAGNKSSHIISLQTIKRGTGEGGSYWQPATATAPYRVTLELFGFNDGSQFRYVSAWEALDLGKDFPAEYIRFGYCRLEKDVWPTSLVGRWYYDAPWEASLLRVAVATVDMAFNEVFTYDVDYITGANGMITIVNRMTASPVW